MKSFLMFFFSAIFLGIQSVVAQEAPYVPNIRDNRILQKAEKSLHTLAEAGNKEQLVHIIGTVKTQLGILTEAKSQYILFALGRMAEEKLPTAISIATQNNNLPLKEDEDIMNTSGSSEQLSPPQEQHMASGAAQEGAAQEDLAFSTTYVEEGKASYYADGFIRTANGEKFDNDLLVAAHKTLPFNTRIKVTNKKNDLRVIVRINDRGPFTPGRIIDLTQAAFKAINNDSLSAGILEVTIEIVE